MNLTNRPLEQIEVEMASDNVLSKLKEWNKVQPEIAYDVRVNNGAVSLIFFDRFVLVREFQEGSYRGAAVGMNVDEDQGEVLFTNNSWFLVDFRTLRNNDLAMEIMNELNENIKDHKLTKHVHAENLDRDGIVEYICDMWRTVAEMKYSIIH